MTTPDGSNPGSSHEDDAGESDAQQGGLSDDPGGTNVLPPGEFKNLDDEPLRGIKPGDTAKVKSDEVTGAEGSSSSQGAESGSSASSSGASSGAEGGQDDSAESGGSAGGGEGGGDEPPSGTAPAPGGNNGKTPREEVLALLDDAIAEAKHLEPGAKRAEELENMVIELSEALRFAHVPILDEDLEAIKQKLVELTGLVAGPARRLKELVGRNALDKGREALDRFKKHRGMS